MSLFGTSPPDESPSMHSSFARSRQSLFDEESPAPRASSSGLFDDDTDGPGGAGSPWDLPTPRKQQNRSELLRNLLKPAEVPESYIAIYDAVLEHNNVAGRVSRKGVALTLAAARLHAADAKRIQDLVAPDGGDTALGRDEFHVLLALIGLAQENDTISLDSVDERRTKLPQPTLQGLVSKAQPRLPNLAELGAKPPQEPAIPTKEPRQPPPREHQPAPRLSMDYPDDPWNTPELHKTHRHPVLPASDGAHEQSQPSTLPPTNGGSRSELVGGPISPSAPPVRTTSTFTTTTATTTSSDPGAGDARQNSTGMGQNVQGSWDYFGSDNAGAGFGDHQSSLNANLTSPFGAGPSGGAVGGSGSLGPAGEPARVPSRTLGSGRTGGAVEEHILVVLMPEKEGVFMFQHHNYEVSSSRRGSKVVRRYSDFVWLLDCLHKRFPFRVLPLLPPKRVAVNGNHFSNDGAFIEKRRRGLARFLNALIRHPILGQEQLVIMFLTVPTELSVWRKQATISVQDEFTGRALPAGLEESLPPQIEELFQQTRSGVQRSTDLYINICNVMDRLVKRTEGVAADHARIAMSLQSLTEVSRDTYATDTNDVPLLNDGLVAMSKHLSTSQSLMEDESKAWDAGVLEDLKRQRDALVSVRELFDRRDRLDKDNIPSLERRIQSNESKLAALRAKPEGMLKPGEVDKVVAAIIKDKESIVDQHNRSIFVKECIRDELIYFQNTQYHVSRWNQDWAQERVKYAEMLADNWRRLLDQLDGMPLGE